MVHILIRMKAVDLEYLLQIFIKHGKWSIDPHLRLLIFTKSQSPSSNSKAICEQSTFEALIVNVCFWKFSCSI
jgi:hypothetical protein